LNNARDATKDLERQIENLSKHAGTIAPLTCFRCCTATGALILFTIIGCKGEVSVAENPRHRDGSGPCFSLSRVENVVCASTLHPVFPRDGAGTDRESECVF
jgi:hypothetical protein